MKKTLLTLFTLLTLSLSFGQDITGEWHGLLEKIGLRVVFHITENDEGFSSTLDSPD